MKTPEATMKDLFTNENRTVDGSERSRLVRDRTEVLLGKPSQAAAKLT